VHEADDRLAVPLEQVGGPPPTLEAVRRGCPWVDEMVEKGGADYGYPLWFLSLGLATFIENGETVAHKFSSGYKEYDKEKTDDKYAEIKQSHDDNKNIGPPLCATIAAAAKTGECSKACATCSKLVLGGTPLHWVTGPVESAGTATGAAEQAETGIAGPGAGSTTGAAKPTQAKLPLIVELGTRLWGNPTVNGQEYRFGAVQSKAIDPRRNAWFDFATNKGGYIKDLMKKAEAAAKREHPTADDIVAVSAADVVMRPLDWIWKGHLLRGSQELMSGLPDLNKSTAQIGLIACATARVPWPDGTTAPDPMNVIMLTAEDTLDQIVVPRLIGAGADASRVTIIKCIKTDEHTQRQFLLAEDLERLERLVQKIGNVGLVTIDPITAYMGGKMDSYKATEVRSQLGPLKDFAERLNMRSRRLPTHGARAIDHFIASQAFIAACRIGHLFVAEMAETGGERVPTGRVLFTNVRNAAHPFMPTLVYRKEEFIISTEPRITAPRLIWEGVVDITAEASIAATTTKKQPEQLKVQAFLRELLKDDKRVAKKEIEEAAEERGFSKKQVRTAGQKLGVRIFKEKGKIDGGWLWQLPREDAPSGS
jgi:hypothetical protein